MALDADRAHHPCGYGQAGQRALAPTGLSPAVFALPVFAVPLAEIGRLLATRSRHPG